MVNSTLRRRTPFRRKSIFPAALLASLFVMLALGGCQFIGMDMFPTTLSRAEAVIDLDSKLADLGVTGEFEITAMTFLTSPTTGKEYIFLKVSTFSQNPWCIVLDAAGLGMVKAIQNQFIGDLFFIDMEGNIATGTDSGGVRFSSVNLEEVPPPLPAFSYRPLAFTDASTSRLVWYDTTTYNVNYMPYIAAWAPGTPDALALDSIAHGDLTLRSLYYQGSTIRLFFNSTNRNPGYIASFPDSAAFVAAFSAANIFAYTGTTVTIIPSGDDQSGWLTRNGAIILTHDNDTRLVRYDSDTGSELDSYTMNDTEDTRFNFSPDGKKWLMYNGRTGKLHLLRTWW